MNKDDFPKKFKICLEKLKDLEEKKSHNAKDPKEKTEEAKILKNIKIKEGESFSVFKQRIREETRPYLQKLTQETKPMRAGRKEFLKRFKNKGKNSQNANTDHHVKIEKDLVKKAKVKFGDVVQEPPRLTAFPKQNKPSFSVKKSAFDPSLQEERARVISLYRKSKEKDSAF